MHFTFIQTLNEVPDSFWSSVEPTSDPFCNRNFLTALEHSKSVGEATGWLPNHLLAYQHDKCLGMLPLYIKNHSYGEYVFDFAWAEAYHRNNLQYYPKLINAIPFTPVTGTRLLVTKGVDADILIHQMIHFIEQQSSELGISSFHTLFCTEQVSAHLQSNNMPRRTSVQFQWFNRQYTDFDDFVSHFTARRRKSVRKERQKIQAQDIEIKRFHGEELTRVEMDFFYLCYCQTYLKRSGHSGYLTKDFFNQLMNTMKHQILLVIASRSGEPIAGALYLFGKQQLCGRYWGALEEADGLHFECCYYQGIEFCIEQNLSSFNPGTQGEHKILRGFEPIKCYSNHTLFEPAFHQAVERFIEQETPGIEEYKIRAAQLLPFKQVQ